MAVKAASEVTITDSTDIDSLVTWYYLTTSATKPAAPTTTKTSVAPPSPWTQAEPTFTAGTVTNYLYTCVQTRWKDGSCAWGAVQLSSAYEQAKQAWNKANAAQDAADAMSETVGTLEAPYTEVEWVESNGKQFVQLDWIPSAGFGFDIDFMLTGGTWGGSGSGIIFGSRDGASSPETGTNRIFSTWVDGGQYGTLRIPNSDTGYANRDAGMYKDGRRQQCSLHGTTYTKPDGTTLTVVNAGTPPTWGMTVFAGSNMKTRPAGFGGLEYWAKVRIYSLKFYDGETLAVDLVGAVRKTDNVPGLYDKVTNKFWASRGLDFGEPVGDIGEPLTLVEHAARSNITLTDERTANSRLLTASAPMLDRLEDGQQITFRSSWAYASEAKATELEGWSDSGSSANCYLKLNLKEGDTGWIPIYYNAETRMTSHYGAGSDIRMTYHENITRSGGNPIARGWWCDVNYNTDTVYSRSISGGFYTGANGVLSYGLCMKDSSGRWTAIVNNKYSNTTQDKTAYTGGLQLGEVLFCSTWYANGRVATNNTSVAGDLWASNIFDFRFCTNISANTTAGKALTVREPVYLVGSMGADGLFYLNKTQWWTQTEPTANDNNVYIYLGIAYSWYQLALVDNKPIYVFRNGKWQLYEKWLADEAAKVATDYITEISGDGIWVTPEDAKPVGGQAASTTTGWHISDALELVKAGVKAFRVWLDNGMAKLRLGEGDRSHVDLDYHSMQMVDKEGNTYFHVSDLRGADGTFTYQITESFEANTVPTLDLPFSVASDGFTVLDSTAGADDTANWSRQQNNSYQIYRVSQIAAKKKYKFTLVTDDSMALAFTFGSRDGDHDVGGTSVTFGKEVAASGSGGFAHGRYSYATGDYSFASGSDCEAQGRSSHAEGDMALALGDFSHAEGTETTAEEPAAHAEGAGSNATGYASHAENESNARGDWSHAEGGTGKLNATYQFVGHNPPAANGHWSHAEGVSTTTAAAAYASHAEGACTTASEKCAHAEGYETSAGLYAHAEGYLTEATGAASHAEGLLSEASGESSHAQNLGTKASSTNQTALGKYNVEDAADAYAVIIGNGTADDARSNALTVAWDGKVNAAGDVTANGKVLTRTRVKGNAESSYRTGDVNLTPANIGALPTEGGTLTGTLTNDKYSFVAKYHGTNDEFNRDGAVPTADRWSTGFYINDKDGETTAFLRSVRRATTGRMDTILYAYNEPNGGGDPVSNSFIVGVERDGTSYYYVPDKPKFRTDMETLGAVTKNGYGGMMHPSGNDTAYMRTTQSGLIPYQSGGASAIGTSAWPFSSGYFNALTVGGVSVRNAGIINAGTLPLARGGTGASLSAAPSIIVDLASTSGASPFAASPKPGVTGILPQAHGGTGLGTAYANITSYDLGSTPIKTSTWTECRYPASGTSAPARVKPGAGVYIVFLSFAFAANANGGRLITAGTTSNVTGYSDSNYLAARLHASNSGTTKSTTATVTEFGADDTLYVRAWQDSGATINCAVHVRLVRIA